MFVTKAAVSVSHLPVCTDCVLLVPVVVAGGSLWPEGPGSQHGTADFPDVGAKEAAHPVRPSAATHQYVWGQYTLNLAESAT